MHAGKVLYSSCAGKHGARYKTNFFKSKSSSRFPNFDASDAWQMGHNSRQGYFLGQELLLDFAAWIDLTSNADNSLISPSCVRSYRTHFASLKRVDDLRVYQGFMMPFNHQAGYKVLKNNALDIRRQNCNATHLFSVRMVVFALTLNRSTSQ